MISRIPKRLFSSSAIRAALQPTAAIGKDLNASKLRTHYTSDLSFVEPETMPKFDTYRLVDNDGNQLDESYKTSLSDEHILKAYKDMVTINVLDSIIYDAQRQGRLSFYIVSAGEEGVAVGSAAALGKDDQMFCQYREQGAVLHRGLTIKQILTQLFARAGDEGHGMSMPVHYQSRELNIHPISSTLATQMPHASGAAYALKLEGTKAISLCYFGEGSSSEGDFHAALNIAATRECPVVFLCRNNGFAISTTIPEQFRGDGVASRGPGYGMPTIRVDGNDFLAMHRVTEAARKLAIEESRPVLIEAMSYRVGHHTTSDDSFAYRSKVEVEDWKLNDNPITRLRKWMEKRGLWTEAEEKAIWKDTRKLILKEMAAVEKTRMPAIGHLFEHVYDEMPKTLRDQRAELVRLLEEYPENYDLSSYEEGIESLKN